MSNLIRTGNLMHVKRWLLASLMLVSILFYAGIVRPWFMNWGATPTEQQMALPGDRYIPANTIVSTQAITIHAPGAQVWAWLVQLGQQHGSFYSYDWLENLFMARMHNADRIVPAWQHPQVGDPVAMMANPPPMSISEIVLLEPARVMVLKGGWTFYLQPINPQTTRLIVRYASFPVKGSLTSALYYYPIFEPAHLVMESGMLMGIKQRAERAADAKAFVANDGLTTTQEVTP